MKILRTIGILALVAGLVLGGAGSAFANGPPDGPPGKRGLFGTVTSVTTIPPGEEYIIHLETKLGAVDLTINGNAKYMVPRETHGPKPLATFIGIVDEDEDGDLEELEGRRVAVLATNVVQGGYVPITADAIRLMLIPSVPLHAHRVGVVEEFTPGSSIKIIDKDDEPHTFTLNGTVYRPDTIAGLTGAALEAEITGGCVTVVTKGDPKKADLEAKAIVLHEGLPDWAKP